VGLQDIFPTLLAFAGEPCENGDSMDLTQIVNGEAKGRDSYVAYFCTDENPNSQRAMLADKQFKYIYNVCGGVEELYDIKKGNCETRNLADVPASQSRLTKMRGQLRCWCHENGHHAMLENDMLRFIPRPNQSEIKPIQNQFGRRKY